MREGLEISKRSELSIRIRSFRSFAEKWEDRAIESEQAALCALIERELWGESGPIVVAVSELNRVAGKLTYRKAMPYFNLMELLLTKGQEK